MLQIAPSTVRSHIARPVCARRLDDEVLGDRIVVMHAENYSVYGVRKIRAGLAREQARGGIEQGRAFDA